MQEDAPALATGDIAPPFTLMSDTGAEFSLSDHLGRGLVLFFYPQADTEGCTLEAQEFTEHLEAFTRLGVEVAGISPDPVDALQAFRAKYGLTTWLLSDPDHVAIDAYGLWRAKTTFGRDYVGLVRTTFLVGADGRIEGIWPVTRIKGHAAAVLQATEARTA